MYICSPMIALLVSNFHKPRNMYIKYANVCVSHSVVSDSLQPHGLYFCQWNSPGKNTGVGCHLFLPGDLPDPGIEARSPALQVDSLPPGKPKYTDTSLQFMQDLLTSSRWVLQSQSCAISLEPLSHHSQSSILNPFVPL